MALLISALILGFAGSLHCAGMCGPIALALPLQGNTLKGKIFGGLLYNLGRTSTYGVMGLFFGLLGQSFRMIGFQQKISLLMGLLMIISVFFPRFFRNQYNAENSRFSFIASLKKKIGELFAVRSFSSLFFVGLLNGLLPCGLVYIAVAGAIGAADVLLGASYMVIFGLGTIPMLLGISLAGNLMSMAVRKRMNRIVPFLIVLVGIFFVLRGLGLGIPFLSPPKDKIEMRFEKSLKETKAYSLAEPPGSCCTEDKR